ncbi:MAG: sodium:proton exchanger [Leptolyngbya sp. PLA3]|nr:MAG: sodium:proton exchanger [Cyanobacteria bacterium CYA]MCE7969490.1 sodium:proton exchanger [Leptolyngbya sp. PL-A3]
MNDAGPSLTLAAGMHNLPLLTTIAAGFAAAWVLGLMTQRIGLSPIVGYLLAGVVIGPYTPGFVGDERLAQQLAEVGVILMMFGVGLHFHLKDLIAVKGVAVPGAIGQSLAATVLAMVAFHFFGWSWKSGAVIGMAMAVASTVVLLRVLMDKDMLNTSHGHVAVGWLIVEDIFTVLALVFVPMLAVDAAVPDAVAAGGAAVNAMAGGVGSHAAPVVEGGPGTAGNGWATIGWAVAKLVALVLIVLFAGSRIVPWILAQVAKLRSRELFTLTVLVLSIAIAVGSATIFGASVALGAFLAGMVVAQSPTSHQAAADALPMRDAFSVLFFVAVGMLFDPRFLVEQPAMIACALAIVLLAKPLAALVIVAVLGYPARSALTVAIGLAQIGEFSFILGQVAYEHHLIPDEGRQILVGAAMISITLNPLLFGSLDRIESWLSRRPVLWKLLNARSDRRQRAINAQCQADIASTVKPLAIIVGYGPVGRVVDALLRDAGLHTVIVEMNMKSVESLSRTGRSVIFGDATRPEILDQAGLRRAAYLVVTLPHSASRADLVHAARELNPGVKIIMRARYLAEGDALRAAGSTRTVFEEGETGIGMARQVMELRGMNEATIDKMLDAIRSIWKMKQ